MTNAMGETKLRLFFMTLVARTRLSLMNAKPMT